MKKVNEKNDDFLMKICGFWIDFEADFKPSILKQDKGVWFSGIEMPENAVRQSLSAFRFVILLRMIPNSYAVKGVFRRKSRFLSIHRKERVWWTKPKRKLSKWRALFAVKKDSICSTKKKSESLPGYAKTRLQSSVRIFLQPVTAELSYISSKMYWIISTIPDEIYNFNSAYRSKSHKKCVSFLSGIGLAICKTVW